MKIMKRSFPYQIISIAEKYLLKGLSYLDKNPEKSNKQRQIKRRKIALQHQVEYVYEDLSKPEQKRIINLLIRQGIELPKSKEKMVKLNDSLKHIKRLEELEKLRSRNHEKVKER